MNIMFNYISLLVALGLLYQKMIILLMPVLGGIAVKTKTASLHRKRGINHLILIAKTPSYQPSSEDQVQTSTI